MSEHDPQAPRVRSGRINLGAPVPMTKVTVRIEYLDGKWVEFIWPGAIDLEFDLDEMRILDLDGSLWELTPTMWSNMKASFRAVPCRPVDADGNEDPFARVIEMRLPDERSPEAAAPGVVPDRRGEHPAPLSPPPRSRSTRRTRT